MKPRGRGFTVFAWALGLWFAAGPASALSVSDCRRDTQELLRDIERNRENSQRQYREALAEAATGQEQDLLKQQMEMIWDEEEQMRGIAEHMLRDCLRHVKSQRDNNTER